jgi:hypothetical protein
VNGRDTHLCKASVSGGWYNGISNNLEVSGKVPALDPVYLLQGVEGVFESCESYGKLESTVAETKLQYTVTLWQVIVRWYVNHKAQYGSLIKKAKEYRTEGGW